MAKFVIPAQEFSENWKNHCDFCVLIEEINSNNFVEFFRLQL